MPSRFRLASQELMTNSGRPSAILAAGAAEIAELGGDHHARALALQRVAEQRLVLALAVGIGRIEEVDAASMASWISWMAAASSEGPYTPENDMQPSPTAETSMPVLPSVRLGND